MIFNYCPICFQQLITFNIGFINYNDCPDSQRHIAILFNITSGKLFKVNFNTSDYKLFIEYHYVLDSLIVIERKTGNIIAQIDDIDDLEGIKLDIFDLDNQIRTLLAFQ